MDARAPMDFEPIAIIGSGCRFAKGASTPEAFWELLRAGTDFVGPVPAERWDTAAIYDESAAETGTTYSKVGAFLEHIDRFDAHYFGISASEAKEMDPQQRLLLEVACESVARAGLTREQLKGSRTAVYVGMLGMDYLALHSREAGIEQINPYYAAGKEFSFAAGRIAYHLGVHGPAMTVTTACSSSLVAMHLACRALQAGEADMALAGGVNLMLAPDLTIYMSQIRAISPSGRCRVFDAAADGIVRGEGCGVTVLKRLADALRDGDPIQAVIRGSAINQDGASAGQTVPNANAQAAVISQALKVAGLSVDDIDYVEAHGTGTPLGDPIELSSLDSAFQGRGRPLWVGSVKANMGHLDAAAGMASVIKTMMVLKHAEVPAQLHLAQLNPLVDWKRSRLAVPTAIESLPDRPRLAGISGFGLSGTNVHMILEDASAYRQAQPQQERSAQGRPWVLPVSARSAQAVVEQARAYAVHLPQQDDGQLQAFVASAIHRRDHFPYRSAVVGANAGQLKSQLEQLPAPTLACTTDEEDRRGPVLVFTGQGAQWVGMGRDLLEREPAFLAMIRRCDQALAQWASWSVEAELRSDASGSRLHLTEFAQPCIFAIQVAISECLRQWGVIPAAVVGHSMGEVAAAYCAGALDLESAVRVIHHRAQAMKDTLGQGRMLVVGLPAPTLQSRLANNPQLELSVVNSRNSCVVSGSPQAVQALDQQLRDEGIFTYLMPAEYAFHSCQMDECLTQIRAGLEDLPVVAAHTPWISTSAMPEEPILADADYWARNARGIVRFDRAIEQLIEQGHRLFVEIGPHTVLAASINQALADKGTQGLVCGALHKQGDAALELASIVARLYEWGAGPDWQAFQPREAALELPAYPWQQERFWFAPAPRPQPAGLVSQLRAQVLVYDAQGNLCAQANDVALSVPQLAQVAVPAPAKVPAAAQPVGDVRAQIGALLTQIIGVACADPDPDRGFFELGLSSISLVEFKRMLERQFALKLSATVGFDYPTINRLGQYLEGLLSREPASTPVTVDAGATDAAGSVAVVAMACRFPQADSPEALWKLMLEQTDTVGPVPPSRLAGAKPEETFPRFASLIQRPEGFDEAFFRISPKEARSMDPQQRLLLMVAWEALERAGIPQEKLLEQRVGVFVGANSHDYETRVLGSAQGVDAHYGTGSSFSAICGRLSHFLGVRGPSLTVDTACSSSLTAIHLACNSLRAAECDIAIVGGVNVIASASIFQSMGQAGALAPDGISKAFDDSADGYGRGEGCGVVILKRQAQAERERDPIVATILGSAVNHDGACAGLTVPNGPAQEALISEALANAGVHPEQVSYVEAHGTGTVLGDPIELNALHNAYRQASPDSPPLTVASVKANIGHLEAAAGIASLIKACLVVEHGRIAPQAHLQRANTRVDWAAMNLKLAHQAMDWPGRPESRVAGVSAFGFTGTNVHVLLKGYTAPATAPLPPATGPVALCLSAATPAALAELAQRYVSFLGATEHCPQTICYNALMRRTAFKERLVVHGQDCRELAQALQAWLAGSPIANDRKPAAGEPWATLAEAFGRGAQSPGPERLPDGCQAIGLPTYPWQLNDYWIDAGQPATAVQPARAASGHPCLQRLVRPAGQLWYWSGALAPQAGHYDPLGEQGYRVKTHLLLDAVLQAVRETPRGVQQIRDLQIAQLRLRGEQHLTSHLSIHLTQAPDACFELALQGAGDERRQVCMSGTLVDCAAQLQEETLCGVSMLDEPSPPAPDVGLCPWSGCAATGGQRALYRFAHSLTAAERQTQLLASVVELFEGAHAAALVGFSGLQVWADLPAQVWIVLAGHDADKPDSLQVVDARGCQLALFEGPQFGHPGSWYLPDLQTAPLDLPMIARQWQDYPMPGEGARQREGYWMVLAWSTAEVQPLAAAFAAEQRPVEVIELRAGQQPLARKLSSALRGAVADPSCLGVIVAGVEAQEADGLGISLVASAALVQAFAGAIASVGTPAKPVWFALHASDAASPAMAAVQATWQGAAHIFALEQPAWWGGLVTLQGSDRRSYVSLCRLLHGQPGHDHFAISGARVEVQYLVEDQADPLQRLEPPALNGTVVLHAVPGSDLEPVLTALGQRGVQRVLLLCEAPGQLHMPERMPEAMAISSLSDLSRENLADTFATLRAQDRIAGFIHLDLDWRTVALKEPEFVVRMQEGVRPLEVLQQVHQLIDDPEAFFLILGSVSSLLGGAGFARSAIADAYALWVHAQRRRQGLNCQLLHLTQSEQELEQDAAARTAMQGSGLQPLQRSQIVQAIARVLGGQGQCGLLNVDWQQLKGLYLSVLPWPLLEHLGAADSAADQRLAELIGLPPLQQRRAMQALVCEVVGQVFGVADGLELDVRKGFFDMGMSSVMSLDLRSRLGRALSIDLPSTFGFEYTSIEQVTDYLMGQLLAPETREPVAAPEPVSPASRHQDLHELSRAELIGALEDELRDIANY